MTLNILQTRPEMAFCGEFSNEDTAQSKCDELQKANPDHFYMVVAPVYTHTFGWVAANRKLWSR